jgi:hypothetical protein
MRKFLCTSQVRSFLLSTYKIWESIGFTSDKSKIFFLQILTF